MTGKELILFILNHNLLDVVIDGSTVNNLFMTIEQAAIKFGVGTNSVEDMIKLGLIDSVEFDGETYIYKNVSLPTLITKRR